MSIRIKLVLVAEGNRLQRENRFARLVHRLDLFLETLGGNDRAEVSIRIDNYPYASGHRDSADAGNKSVALRSFCADADADWIRPLRRGCRYRYCYCRW